MTAPRCRVMLVGEGPNDIGDLGSHYAKGNEGFLQPILRKLAGDLELEIIGKRIVNLGSIKAKRKKLRGHGKKLFAAIVSAAAEGASVVVFVHDSDRTGVGVDLDAEYEHLQAAQEAAEEQLESTPIVVVGLAVCTIEAWAMGDAGAWTALSRRPLPKGFPKKPEKLWGKAHDPKSSHPKQVFVRMAEESALSATFAEIAEASDVERLAEACPSFARFRGRADTARESCPVTPNH